MAKRASQISMTKLDHMAKAMLDAMWLNDVSDMCGSDWDQLKYNDKDVSWKDSGQDKFRRLVEVTLQAGRDWDKMQRIGANLIPGDFQYWCEECDDGRAGFSININQPDAACIYCGSRRIMAG